MIYQHISHEKIDKEFYFQTVRIFDISTSNINLQKYSLLYCGLSTMCQQIYKTISHYITLHHNFTLKNEVYKNTAIFRL